MTSIDTHVSGRIAEQPRGPLRDVVNAVIDSVSAMIDTLLDWQDRARQRRALLSLGERALQDFGASRADSSAEGDKPFWRA
ncbi:MAG TPA: DUF1127 domain-containing protein [Dongiaceae bacterium]|jgi:uncharacterized protein YjiS (DUF1127 family)